MSSVKSSLVKSFFVSIANTIKIKGKTIPEISHHFEPITMISSRIPDKSGTLFGTKNISKLKHITRLSDAITIGIILFLFIDLR